MDISALRTYFDEIEESKGDVECEAWLRIVNDVQLELGTFVSARRGGGAFTKCLGFLKGSFNFSVHFKFDDGGPDALIRFPKPGHVATALRDEKLANEVQAMEYIREKTTIPIPRVYSWGLTADSPHQLGPFIIMDYVEGTMLAQILKQPRQQRSQDHWVLNPDIDNQVLERIYRQIAGFLLQLSQLRFARIGAISKDGDGTWSANKRPLTFNMNDLATVAGCSADGFPTSTFDQTSDYFEAVAQLHLGHLWTQRGLAENPQVAQARFFARHRFAQLIPEYCIHDEGPFIPFCDDLRPSNMLVNPQTLEITAVLDFEFTNAMPAQFSYDPPWWLLLSGPETWLDRGAMEEFLDLYEPRMVQFLDALEHVEDTWVSEGQHLAEPPLSARMRDSWQSGRFWFDYAARKSFEVDSIYWAALHEDGVGIEALDLEARSELRPFVTRKMQQLSAYQEEVEKRSRQQEDK